MEWLEILLPIATTVGIAITLKTALFSRQINQDSLEEKSESDNELLKKTKIVKESKEVSSCRVNSDLLRFRHGCIEEIMRNISLLSKINHESINIENLNGHRDNGFTEDDTTQETNCMNLENNETLDIFFKQPAEVNGDENENHNATNNDNEELISEINMDNDPNESFVKGTNTFFTCRRKYKQPVAQMDGDEDENHGAADDFGNNDERMNETDMNKSHTKVPRTFFTCRKKYKQPVTLVNGYENEYYGVVDDNDDPMGGIDKENVRNKDENIISGLDGLKKWNQ